METTIHCAYDEMVDVDNLIANPRNPNTHPDEQVELLSKIIVNQGWRVPITVSNRSGFIVRGHARLKAALLAGLDRVPVDYQDYVNEAVEWADLIADNRIAELAEIDRSMLKDLLEELDTGFIDMDLTGFGEDSLRELMSEFNVGERMDADEARRTLMERFVVPPFSVLDARQGYWQNRKQAWIGLGIESEVGREATMASMRSAYRVKMSASSNRRVSPDSIEDVPAWAESSIFDPVLCEVVYRWFCPVGGTVLDPFAGGSVRGIVAAKLGLQYTGIDLRPEQITANEAQAERICDEVMPTWLVGDARNVTTISPGKYDLVFSCPPYFDLEVYSDDSADLSKCSDYESFLKDYRRIISDSVAMLKPDRFACFVVGDIRDKKGFYRNFPSDTIDAFREAGARLYNYAILITQLGTASIRCGMFQKNRKLVKTHQDVLVFYKGDPKRIRDFGEVECGEIISSDDEY